MPRLTRDTPNAIRRRLGQTLDQAWATMRKKLAGNKRAEPFDDDPRYALITVNYSTTRYLKLMLLTLCEQNALQTIRRIIVVDNGSRDGGLPFLERLAGKVERVHLLKNRLFRNHAQGLRRGIALLERLEAGEPAADRCNLLLICDPDIIFRDPATLEQVADTLHSENAALAGELRRQLYPLPEAQASFLCLRRDSYCRKDVAPFTNHGAPAWQLQRSLWRAGLKLADFPSNRGGYILHRGRGGVAAAGRHHRLDPYATVAANRPHYMGIERGAKIWQQVEQKYADDLLPGAEDRLLERLALRLGVNVQAPQIVPA